MTLNVIFKSHWDDTNNSVYYRAITADRRGIEPDSYVFQVPEHEEGPLGPLTLTSRRGNVRKENSFRTR